jgi:hypothetical protein
MFRLTMFTMVTTTLAVGCGADSPQTISGRVATGSFPEPVTRVVAIGEDGTFYAPVSADGTFDLAVPAGDRYRIELRSTVRGSQLVFDRGANIDTTFFVVESGETFDLGEVRYEREARDADTTISDAAIPDHSPEASLGGDDGEGGGHDEGGGGQDTGGGRQDEGGGGQDTGGGGQDTGGGGGE